MINKKKCCFILVLFIVFHITGCVYDEHQTKYHENVEDIEQYILNELGNYIYFSKPIIEASINAEERNKRITWNVYFLREYIYDDTKISSYPPARVIARFRELYNSFISSHTDHFLCDYTLCIYINVPSKDRDGKPPSQEIAFLTSYDFMSWDNANTLLIGIALPNEYWSYMYDQTDVRIASMTDNSIEQIIEVIDNMTSIERIIVKDNDTAEEVETLRPSSVFISIADGK